MLVEIAVMAPDLVELRWQQSYDQIWYPGYQVLADAVATVPGVERVQVFRFSAQVITKPETHLELLLQALEQLLKEHPKITAYWGDCTTQRASY